MATKRYYWLKLKDNFFKNKKIKKLRRIAGGDTYTIIYLKMQLLSINDNGKLYFENVEDSFAEELALELDENIDNVKMTLIFLIKNGLLVEVNPEEFILPETVECIGSETSKAELMRKKRSKEKAIEGNNVTTLLPPVTESYTEKDIRDKSIENRVIDIDIEKDKEREEKKDNKYFSDDNLNSIFEEFIEVRKKLKAVNSDRAIKTLINKLNKYDDATKYQMIENSIVNSWKDVYELKQQKTFTNKPVREEVVPSWLNKNIASNELTSNEEAEMEELLSEFKEGTFEDRKAKLEAKLKAKYGKKGNDE